MQSAQTKIKKYLDIYANDFSVHEFLKTQEIYNYVLVIPVFCESKLFFKNLSKFLEYQQQVLVIIIINFPENSSQHEITQNFELLDFIKKKLVNIKIRNIKTCGQINNHKLIILGPIKLNSAHGVGAARKIGCDIALRLIYSEKIICPIIFNTDADAQLPNDYFSRSSKIIKTNFRVAALVYPFLHINTLNLMKKNRNQYRAIKLYEGRLNQYVSGLQKAGSPYGYHTVGSTIAICALNYALVRGMPKRSAGEDFHVLNKLRKTGEIINLSGEPIKLSSRASLRVPFGTGPFVHRLILSQDILREEIFYHPKIFIILKIFLNNIKNKIIANQEIKFEQEDFLNFKLLNKNLHMRKNIKNKLKAFDDWFDALKTLRFIHKLRDQNYPMLNFFQLRAQPGFQNYLENIINFDE